MRKLLWNLISEKSTELLPVRTLNHARVQAVHDHGLKLPAKILVQAIDELLRDCIWHPVFSEKVR